MVKTFKRLESEVRGYCRAFPTIFTKAQGSKLWDRSGREYLDFLAGAGSLNYGHNNPVIKSKLIEYLSDDGIVHGLDMATQAKKEFLEAFDEIVLKPRELCYKMQFTGPTGTNAVEAALKLARRATGRQNVVAFTNGFHGVTLGALGTTANSHYRKAAGVLPPATTFMPFDGYLGPEVDTAQYLERVLSDGSSGMDHPAAVLVETVQGEGGINVASFEWLRKLQLLCRKHRIVLIVDDIQMGCGRTGRFFSFEKAGITPDVVTLSKSLSAYGLPFSLVLMRPDLDQWQPGEHNGTFRGNNLAFVSATTACNHFWRDPTFSREVERKGQHMREALESISDRAPEGMVTVRGRGMVQGLDCRSGELASAITAGAFDRGLVIETSGAEDQVVKCLPPLTIPDSELGLGLDRLADSVAEASRRVSLKRELRAGAMS